MKNNQYCEKCSDDITFPNQPICSNPNCLCHQNKDWGREFFDRLSSHLEELFPKTNQEHPEKLSKGNRTTALVLNAFANIIFKDILQKAVSHQKSETIREIREMKLKDDGNLTSEEWANNKLIDDILEKIK